MAQPIGSLGMIPTLTIDGRVFTDLTSLIILATYTNGNNRGTFRMPGASSGYAVTSGKTLKLYAGTTFSVSTNESVVQIAQSDNDVGLDSATAFTNPVYYGGGSTNTFGPMKIYGAASISPWQFALGGMSIAATKYAGIHIFTALTCVAHVYGYET